MAKKIDPESAAKSAYLKAKRKGKRIPELEPAILKSPEWAERYAWACVKGRWKEAEPVIAKDPEASIRYAFHVLKDRFPLGEKRIAKDGTYACDYAAAVVRGRWQPGEAAIARSPFFMLHYAKKALKGPLPKPLHERMVALYLQDYEPSEMQRLVAPQFIPELKRANPPDPSAEKYCTSRKYMGPAVMGKDARAMLSEMRKSAAAKKTTKKAKKKRKS